MSKLSGKAGAVLPEITKVIDPLLAVEGDAVISQCNSWSAKYGVDSEFVCNVQDRELVGSR
jgi:hypothetical protein